MTDNIYNKIHNYSWLIESDRGDTKKTLVIRDTYGTPILRASGHEVIELLGPEFVHRHIKVCENELRKWKDWAQEDLVRRLSADSTPN